MTEAIEQLIQARFDRIANPADDADWSDVLARMGAARSARRRRAPIRVALAAAVALAATAVGFGWPQSLIDFFAAQPAPVTVKNWFGAQNVSAPPGMNPMSIPGQARRIATATFDANGNGRATVHALYVAPKRGGGFCYLWTDASAGCVPTKSAPKALGPLGVDWFGNDYAVLLAGWVRTGATRTVVARFADGTTDTIPVTWVSAPVDAGFFIYPVPAAHRSRADALRSIVALDGNGSILGTQTFLLTKPLDEDVRQTLPDGTTVGQLPRRAHAAQARKIVSFRATDGSHVYLWVMPRTGGGECFFYNQGSGCASRSELADSPILNVGMNGGARRILLFAQAKPEVAAIELRYQNGTSERLTPVDGFVLHEITPAHYKRGTRLVSAVALDRRGKALFTERFRPLEAGFYPCKKPISRGYGVKMCP